MRIGSCLAILLALGCAGTTGDPGESRQAGRQGEELYQQYCSGCHGVAADGRGSVGAMMDPRPPDLTRIAARNGGVFPQAAVVRTIDGRDPVIAHGPREMPIWGERFAAAVPPSADKAAARRGMSLVIVEYLRGLQRP